jgi:hypothetical protein
MISRRLPRSLSRGPSVRARGSDQEERLVTTSNFFSSELEFVRIVLRTQLLELTHDRVRAASTSVAFR